MNDSNDLPTIETDPRNHVAAYSAATAAHSHTLRAFLRFHETDLSPEQREAAREGLRTALVTEIAAHERLLALL